MNTENTKPIYWVLFYGNSQALQDLYDYQQEHYGTGIDEPPEPLPQTPKIDVNTDEIDVEKFMASPPLSEGRGY